MSFLCGLFGLLHRNRAARRLAVGYLVVALPALASANDLIDAYTEALSQDQTFQAALHQRDASVEARPQALASLLPQLSGTAAYNRERVHVLPGQQVTSPCPFTRADPDGKLCDIYDNVLNGVSGQESGTAYFNAFNYSVSMTQTLFNWSAFQTLAQSGKQIAEAEAVFRSAQQSLIYRTADAYFNVLNAQDTLRADDESRLSLKRQFDESSKKFDVGLANITDVRNAQASYDTSNATVIADRRALDSARRSLAQLTGQPIDKIAPLRDEIPLKSPDPVDVDSWVKAAADGNPDLMDFRYAAEVAHKAIEIDRAKHLPTIDLAGSVGRTDAEYSLGTDSISDVIGVQATWNFSTGGLIASQVRQAKAQYAQAEASLEGERRVIDQDVRDSYEGVISGIASVNATLQAVKSNRISLDASQVGVKVGTRTEVDVITAQQALALAERTYYSSRYDYLRSQLLLKEYAGLLRPADLIQIDQLLTESAPFLADPPSTAP